MKVTVIVAAVRRLLSNPVVREFGRTVRRHLTDVIPGAIEVVLQVVRRSRKAPKTPAGEER